MIAKINDIEFDLWEKHKEIKWQKQMILKQDYEINNYKKELEKYKDENIKLIDMLKLDKNEYKGRLEKITELYNEKEQKLYNLDIANERLHEINEELKIELNIMWDSLKNEREFKKLYESENRNLNEDLNMMKNELNLFNELKNMHWKNLSEYEEMKIKYNNMIEFEKNYNEIKDKYDKMNELYIIKVEELNKLSEWKKRLDITHEQTREVNMKMNETMKLLYQGFSVFKDQINKDKEAFNMYKSFISSEMNNMKFIIENTKNIANTEYQNIFNNFKAELEWKNNELQQMQSWNIEYWKNEYTILYNNFNQMMIKNNEQYEEIDHLRNELYNQKEKANKNIQYLLTEIGKNKKIDYEKDNKIIELNKQIEYLANLADKLHDEKLKNNVLEIEEWFKSLKWSSWKQEQLNLWWKLKEKVWDLLINVNEFEIKEEEKKDDWWQIIFKKPYKYAMRWGSQWMENDYEKEQELNLEKYNYLVNNKQIKKIEGKTVKEQLKNYLKAVNKTYLNRSKPNDTELQKKRIKKISEQIENIHNDFNKDNIKADVFEIMENMINEYDFDNWLYNEILNNLGIDIKMK